ncbi:ABC transporter permease [bacterium]|nr:MAG: ABC transporter permease [bacterium]RIK64437.1 MAG: peptide ABC transporter permease [Planctomycetota bacterium]
MLSYIVRRLFQMALTLWIVSVLSFLIVALAPGDPLASQLDPKKTPADLERRRDEIGYDDPVVKKYTDFYSRFFSDFGAVVSKQFGGGDNYSWQLTSETSKEAVLPTMWRKMLVTLPLVIVNTLLVWSLSFPIGIYSALRRNTVQDRAITVLSYTLIAFPGFWISILIIGFVTKTLGIPIVSPETIGVELEGPRAFFDRTWHIAIPAFVGALTGVATLTRYVKGQMMEVMGQDYIRTAKAKGLDDDQVYYKHALRPASLPFITMLAGLLPSIFGGSVVFEAIYSWPGLGRWVFEAVFQRDIYIVMTSLFVGSALTLIGILVSDILLSVADPRVRLS